jgi:hypothetical protein
MRTPLDVLNGLEVEHPCPASWAAMPGDARTRHCSSCDKAVHDLSERTAAEAAELLTRGERVCVRFTRRADGTVVTWDRRWVRRLVQIAAALFGGLVLTGCGGGSGRTTMGTPCSWEKPSTVPTDKKPPG